MVGNDPRKFQIWLFEVGHVIDLLDGDSGLIKAKSNRFNWKLGGVLHATKAFFLRGSDHLAVMDEACRGIVVKTRDAEHVQIKFPRR
jgi:hypothetical protein